jgi:hypothetical protein
MVNFSTVGSQIGVSETDMIKEQLNELRREVFGVRSMIGELFSKKQDELTTDELAAKLIDHHNTKSEQDKKETEAKLKAQFAIFSEGLKSPLRTGASGLFSYLSTPAAGGNYEQNSINKVNDMVGKAMSNVMSNASKLLKPSGKINKTSTQQEDVNVAFNNVIKNLEDAKNGDEISQINALLEASKMQHNASKKQRERILGDIKKSKLTYKDLKESMTSSELADETIKEYFKLQNQEKTKTIADFKARKEIFKTNYLKLNNISTTASLASDLLGHYSSSEAKQNNYEQASVDKANKFVGKSMSYGMNLLSKVFQPKYKVPLDESGVVEDKNTAFVDPNETGTDVAIDRKLYSIKDTVEDSYSYMQFQLADDIIDKLKGKKTSKVKAQQNTKASSKGQSLFDKLKGLWDIGKNLYKGIKNIFKGGWKLLKNIGSKLWDIGKSVFEKAGRLWRKLKLSGRQIISSIKNVGMKAWNGIKNVAGKAWQATRSVGGKALRGGGKLLSQGGRLAAQGGRLAMSGVGGLGSMAMSGLSGIGALVGGGALAGAAALGLVGIGAAAIGATAYYGYKAYAANSEMKEQAKGYADTNVKNALNMKKASKDDAGVKLRSKNYAKEGLNEQASVDAAMVTDEVAGAQTTNSAIYSIADSAKNSAGSEKEKLMNIRSDSDSINADLMFIKMLIQDPKKFANAKLEDIKKAQDKLSGINAKIKNIKSNWEDSKKEAKTWYGTSDWAEDEKFLKSGDDAIGKLESNIKDITPTLSSLIKEFEESKKVIQKTVNEAPKAIEKPVVAETPKAIEKPVVAETPKAIEKPVVAETPKAIEKPLVKPIENKPSKPISDDPFSRLDTALETGKMPAPKGYRETTDKELLERHDQRLKELGIDKLKDNISKVEKSTEPAITKMGEDLKTSLKGQNNEVIVRLEKLAKSVEDMSATKGRTISTQRHNTYGADHSFDQINQLSRGMPV